MVWCVGEKFEVHQLLPRSNYCITLRQDDAMRSLSQRCVHPDRLGCQDGADP